MPEEWAKSQQPSHGSGHDLHLDLGSALDARTGGLRTALVRALREAVRTGRLAPGTRLPSSRQLAADLGIARNTVAEAYSELVAEGRLTAARGAGTRVARRAEPPGPRPGRPAPSGPEAPLRTHTRMPVRPAHDLRTGIPDVSAFPRTAWAAASRRALAAAPSEALRNGDLRGSPGLRRALADYLARARGVRADPERILVGAGFAQLLTVLARVLPGEAAVETYGLPYHHRLLADAGVRSRPLPLDAHGARTGSLAEAAGVRAVLLTPAHQFPTGVPLHPDRRAAVVDWARRGDGLVVEDDYDGEFRYDRKPVGALQGLDSERVVYCGTASKALFPALRLAWAVLPSHLLGPALAAKAPGEWTTGVLDQLTLADFLESGGYDRHVRAMRQRYRRRRDRLVAALERHVPQARVTGIAAGLHAIVELPPGAEESAVLAEADRRGIALEGLAGFRHPAAAPDGPHVQALVVGYGAPPEHAFPAALDALTGLLTDTAR
ncbi:PLP-dependent aminotransferase family protein [Streptomyces sp. HNM0574]|uniref:MocR-like pyridoxine biosynthesis transcription factor PdxR n=1 Tax=Streptomyces sp. HNM0574 TaxID=2714954 RepID=UPI00146A830B|nr:PLP-dependent aminotransferase family protein [Streptomyces sp. HNM0574]NLU66812.1 PLP-dependent aminotransferase family protein [Streptomyces sp. HNM0574]